MSRCVYVTCFYNKKCCQDFQQNAFENDGAVYKSIKAKKSARRADALLSWWKEPKHVCDLQGEAIAVNLREMFGFRVPILSVVIGEGGSGGALAIGCANRNLIMEHSVYYVASPEACAAILWKARDKAATVSIYRLLGLHHCHSLQLSALRLQKPICGKPT